MHPLRYYLIWQAVGLTLIALVIYLSLTAKPPSVPGFDLPGADKLGHLLAYFLLMGWHVQIYHRRAIRIGLAVGFIMMGIVLEFAQGQGGMRMFEWFDALANSLGVIIAWSLARRPYDMLLCRLEPHLCRLP